MSILDLKRFPKSVKRFLDKKRVELILRFPKSVKRFLDKKRVEQILRFPKSVKRFLDKKRGKKKKLEPHFNAIEMGKALGAFFEKHGFELNSEFKRTFTIAVSGGGDSLALALLCANFAKANKNFKFICAIVDHGIAINSSHIAQNAKKTVEQMGLEAQILKVPYEIKAPIQENARNARYNLVTEFNFKNNSNAILLGHNFDDQIETIAFRLLRKTGLIGLGGIAQAQKIENFSKPALLLRPILNLKRAELREFLNASKVEYFDDPANENINFSRVAIRKKIKKINNENIWNKLYNIGIIAGELRNELNQFYTDFAHQNLKFENEKIICDYNKISNLNNFFGVFLIGNIIQEINSKPYQSNSKSLEAFFEKIKSENFKSGTLGNVWVKKLKNNLVFMAAPARKHKS